MEATSTPSEFQVFSGSYRRPNPTQAAADAIPLLIDDIYHVLHLTTPPNTTHHPPRLRSTWSRLRSRDLVQWARDEDAVITPTTSPSPSSESSLDTDGAWTGSAILDPHGNLRIFYTGYNLTHNGKQTILSATSSDRHGSRFEQAGKEIIIVSSSQADRTVFEDIDFRDPHVFHTQGQYWMLVGTRLASGPYWSRGCIALLKSSDLEIWHLSPQPLYAPNDMFCPECPEIFKIRVPKLGEKWYLVYSRFHAPNPGTVYRVADSPHGPFRIPRDGNHGQLDGRRWYAAKSCAKAGDPDKRIFFGWIADWNEHDSKWLWGGDLALPREASANEDGTLRLEPAVELRSDALMEMGIAVETMDTEESLFLEAIACTEVHYLTRMSHSNHAHHIFEFDVALHDCVSFGIIFRPDNNGIGYKLRFTPSVTGFFTASIETPFASLDDFWADQYQLYLPRPIDGPEIVRHENLRDIRHILLYVVSDTVQIFVGGRSMTFRLVPLPQQLEKEAARMGELYAFFVEDGKIELGGIKMTVMQTD